MLETLSALYQSWNVFPILLALLAVAVMIFGYYLIMAAGDPDLPIDTTPTSDTMLWTGPKGHGTEQGGVYPMLAYPDLPESFAYPPCYVIVVANSRPLPAYIGKGLNITLNPADALVFGFAESADDYAQVLGLTRYHIQEVM